MSKRSAQHATFIIERAYNAAPARVFAAWADPTAKARWFVGPDEWEKSDHKLELRQRRLARERHARPSGNCVELFQPHVDSGHSRSS